MVPQKLEGFMEKPKIKWIKWMMTGGTPMTLEFAQNSFQILNLRNQFLCDRSRRLKKNYCIIRTQKHGRPPLRSILVPIPTKKMHVWLMYTNVAGIAKCLLQHISFWFPNKHSIVFPGVDIPTSRPTHGKRSKNKILICVFFLNAQQPNFIHHPKLHPRMLEKQNLYTCQEK